MSTDKQDEGRKREEDAHVQLAWDDEFLYVAFSFEDSDIVQESESDQAHHYLTGDVAELFLKPRDETWYWEFYVTPNGLKTAFFYPGRGRLGLPSNLDYQSRIRVAAQVDGTINNWGDHDRRWTAEIAVPLSELADQGIPLDDSHPWQIFVSRYNYGRYLPYLEHSMMPTLSQTDFHHYEEWGNLELRE